MSIQNKPAITSLLGRIHEILLAAAFLALLGLGTYNALAYRVHMTGSLDNSNAGNDMVSTWDRRMRKMLPDLPDHGVIGYLADWDIPDYQYGYSDQTVEYLLTQYSLAPLTLQRGADYPLVIGNFSDNGDPGKIPGILELFDLKIVKAHTNEIFILESRD